jgi:GTP cyclohydrolase II
MPTLTTEVKRLRDDVLRTAHGTFCTRVYRGASGQVGVALWMGELALGAALPSRVHSSCFTSEGLGALDCDCVTQLDGALRAIAGAGRGLVLYLLQEGRGAGLRAKVRDREMVQASGGTIDTFVAYERLGFAADPRSYGLVPAMCADLGVAPSLQLMTNNPAKIASLVAAGIAVERIEHSEPASDLNVAYLAAKARTGHALRVPISAGAKPPPALESLDPKLPSAGRFDRVGSYSVPIRAAGGFAWFRATAYYEPQSGHNRLVLGYRAHAHSKELRHIFRESLDERFAGGEALARYREAIRSILDHGAGTVLAAPADCELLTRHPGPTDGEDRALLDAHCAAIGATSWEDVA